MATPPPHQPRHGHLQFSTTTELIDFLPLLNLLYFKIHQPSQHPIQQWLLSGRTNHHQPTTDKQEQHRDHAGIHRPAQRPQTAAPPHSFSYSPSPLAQSDFRKTTPLNSPASCPPRRIPRNIHNHSFRGGSKQTNKQTGRSRGTSTTKTKSPAISQTTAPMPMAACCMYRAISILLDCSSYQIQDP
jgi:hypothetical protein